VHPDNGRLAELGSKGGAHVVRPETPPSDMKESVRLALEFAASFEPAPTDAWLVAPADVPGLATTTIDRLIAGYEAAVAQEGAPKRIWAPQCQGRRGHPVLLPWSLAAEVARLAPDQGLNSLVDRGPVEYVEVAPDALGDDVDTPADYNRLRERYGI
jgi:molybdenum cofactor cytidylyltransferase